MKLRQSISRLAAAGALVASAASSNAAVLLSEGFDNIATLPGAGWVIQNNSSPVGTSSWFQGNSAVFPAASGASDSYIGANFDSATVGGRVSNWLITPVVALDSASVLTFALRMVGEGFLDTVEVYLSSAGSSTDVGTSSTSTGDFSLLQSFSNSGADTGWVGQSIDLSALATGSTGRLAFRYFVDDTSIDGNYVGVDSVTFSTRDVVAVSEPAPAALLALALAGMAALRRRH